MASSNAVFDILIPTQTPVAPGAEVLSTVVDVRGSTSVHFTLTASRPNYELQWVVLFGPTQSGKLVETCTGSFTSTTEAIVTPTFGVKFALAVRNHGETPTEVEGNYYFVKG